MRKLSNRSLAEIPVWRDVPHPEQERFADTGRACRLRKHKFHVRLLVFRVQARRTGRFDRSRPMPANRECDRRRREGSV